MVQPLMLPRTLWERVRLPKERVRFLRKRPWNRNAVLYYHTRTGTENDSDTKDRTICNLSTNCFVILFSQGQGVTFQRVSMRFHHSFTTLALVIYHDHDRRQLPRSCPEQRCFAGKPCASGPWCCWVLGQCMLTWGTVWWDILEIKLWLMFDLRFIWTKPQNIQPWIQRSYCPSCCGFRKCHCRANILQMTLHIDCISPMSHSSTVYWNTWGEGLVQPDNALILGPPKIFQVR